MRTSGWACASVLLALLSLAPAQVVAGTINVPAGGDLQAAINAAKPGDTILLEAGAEYVGNFVLPAKTGDTYILIRSSTPDSLLPGPGERITPAHAPALARIRSGNTVSALLTEPGAHHWHLRYLEFAANNDGHSEIIRLGDGSSAQNSLSLVPHHFILDHLYVHGDPLRGQKRGIATNVGHFELRDSHISDIKAVGQDTQAVGGWNGPGPFTIENNYLEAAGENVLFGGAYPYIPGLVADGVVLRWNLISRPMAWKNPIVATPAQVEATAKSGGSLAAGTYAYRIVARRPVGQGTIGRSTASADATAAVAAGGAVRIRWQAVPDATEYRVYGRTPGGQSMYWRVTGTEFVDTGSSGTAEAVPTSAGTTWTVKNLFELKSARNVLVEKNILENHWKHAQPGYAIVYTPRSSGGCSWCTVENVTFQYNLVRNVSAGVNILGYDNTAPTGQANNLIFRQNLFVGMRKSLGGNAYFMQIGDAPRDITVDHNTIDSDGNVVVYVYGGSSTNPEEVYGFQMTNNAARHGLYGMHGTYFTWGLGIINAYYPDGVFLSNYLAGAPASRYPSGTLVSGLFEDQFTNPAAGDYTVRSDSILYHAATDGTDVGVDVEALAAAIAGVEDGAPSAPQSSNKAPVAGFSFVCSGLTCSFTDQSSDTDGSIAGWGWDFSDGAPSSLKDPVHMFAASGTYAVTLMVTDDNGATATVTHGVTVASANVAPTAAFTFACDGLACTFFDGSSDPDGSIGSRDWSFGDGASGTGTSPSHTFAAGGTYSVRLTVTDDDGEAAAVTQAVTVAAPAPAPAPAGVHVGDLAGTTIAGRKNWYARVTITVHSSEEQPVAGAVVQYSWVAGSLQACTTNTLGQCTIESDAVLRSTASLTLTVEGILSALGPYQRSADHDPDGDSTGTVITIGKP